MLKLLKFFSKSEDYTTSDFIHLKHSPKNDSIMDIRGDIGM